jgi:hypothetical protein
MNKPRRSKAAIAPPMNGHNGHSPSSTSNSPARLLTQEEKWEIVRQRLILLVAIGQQQLSGGLGRTLGKMPLWATGIMAALPTVLRQVAKALLSMPHEQLASYASYMRWITLAVEIGDSEEDWVRNERAWEMLLRELLPDARTVEADRGHDAADDSAPAEPTG